MASWRSTLWRKLSQLVNPPWYQPAFFVVESLHLARAYYVAAELGIADLLKERRLTIAELAAATSSNEQSLLRMLRTLAAFGVFAQDRAGRFRMTRRARVLLGDSPGSIRDWLILMGRTELWQGFACTLEGVRSGTPPFELAHGTPFYTYIDEHPEFAATFFAALENWTAGHCLQVARALDFGRYRTVVDVGGGMGLLLEKILARFPEVRGTLFDRAEAIRAAEPRFRAAGLGDRCQFVAGSFFETIPAGHDAYILKHVINDWDDAGAREILCNVHRSMSEGATVLIIGAIVDPRNNRDRVVKLLDLENGALLKGRFRTEEELTALLTSSGFELVQVHPTGLSDLQIVEARPATGTVKPAIAGQEAAREPADAAVDRIPVLSTGP